MKKLVKAASLFFALGLMTLFSGCDKQDSVSVVNEIDEPMFRRAKDLIDRGKKGEALENFLKLIVKRDDNAPESHLEVGRIYLYHIKDPISAIYHLKRYKSLEKRNPMGPNAGQKMELVDELVQTAMKDFASSFDAEIFQYPLERLSFVDTIEDLKNENEALKVSLEQARRQIRSLGHTPPAGLGSGYASGDRAESQASRPQAQTPRPQAQTVRPQAQTPRPQAQTTRPQAQPQVQPQPRQERPQTSARSQPQRPGSTTTLNQGDGAPRIYTIRPGDTLYSISLKVYGDGGRWQEILRANRGVIPDSNRLQVNTRLVIP